MSCTKGCHSRRGSLAGKALRDACPRKAHAAWKAPAGRPDPVQLVLEAEKGRLPEQLVKASLPDAIPVSVSLDKRLLVTLKAAQAVRNRAFHQGQMKPDPSALQPRADGAEALEHT